MPIKPISVSQLNSYIKRIIVTDPVLGNIAVKGEISNLVYHRSGHIYFTLKDENSRLTCFLSSDKVSKLRFILSEGMEIIIYGNIAVYEKGGTYSLNVRDVDLSGQGTLNIAFENLKEKLLKEGLFDSTHKKTLPAFPRKIAVITSPTGAAVRDIITTIKKKTSLVDIMVYPCLVQGEQAAQSITDALAAVNASFPSIDLIILGRGGGSMEDLWAFNEEIVARAVFHSRIPIISAVGHETDNVIADYVSDARAATPTAAAEVSVGNAATVKSKLTMLDPLKLCYDLNQKIGMAIEKCMYLKQNATSTIELRLREIENKVNLCALNLELSNPMNMLDRGYVVVSKENGEWLVSSSAVRVKDKLVLIMKDGTIHCTVENVEESLWLNQKRH